MTNSGVIFKQIVLDQLLLHQQQCPMWVVINILSIGRDHFRSIFTTLVASAQIWAMSIVVNNNAKLHMIKQKQIVLDQFYYIGSAQIWAIDIATIAINGNNAHGKMIIVIHVTKCYNRGIKQIH